MSDEMNDVLGQLRAIQSADMITAEVAGQLGVLEKRFKREYPFLFFAPRPDQQKFLDADFISKCLISGNRWGKTQLLVYTAVALMNGTYKSAIPLPAKWEGPLQVKILSDTVGVQDEVILPKLRELMSPKTYQTFHQQKRVFRYPDGGRLWLDTYGQDTQALAGTSPHVALFDECPPREKWVEVTRGLVDYEGWDWIFYTPAAGMNWLFDRYKERKINGTYFQSGSMWDNCIENGGVLTRKSIEAFMSKLTESEIRARIFGEWVAITDSPVFDIAKIDARKPDLKKPILESRYDANKALGIQVGPNDDGDCWVWEYPVSKPDRIAVVRESEIENIKTGVPKKTLYATDNLYIIAVDASGGGLRGDPAAIQIGRRDTLEQVLEVQTHMEPQSLAKWVAMLGRYYHNAFVIVETGVSKHGALVVEHLISKENYYNLYAENEGKTLGFATTAASKPKLIGAHRDDLAAATYWTVRSDRLVEEQRLYSILNDREKMGAAKGAHDDLMMAWMLLEWAHVMCPMPKMIQTTNPAITKYGKIDYELARKLQRRTDMKSWSAPPAPVLVGGTIGVF